MPGAPRATPTTEASPGGLSQREREVAVMVARGLTNRAIAEALVLSERPSRRTWPTRWRSLASPRGLSWRPRAVEQGLRQVALTAFVFSLPTRSVSFVLTRARRTRNSTEVAARRDGKVTRAQPINSRTHQPSTLVIGGTRKWHATSYSHSTLRRNASTVWTRSWPRAKAPSPPTTSPARWATTPTTSATPDRRGRRGRGPRQAAQRHPQPGHGHGSRQVHCHQIRSFHG